MTRIRLLAITLLSLISSTAWADLKTYDIDPRYRTEIYEALRNILNPEGVAMAAYGRVQLLPSGQILVNAPPDTITQVDAVIKALQARPVDAAPRVTLRYWAVLGTRTQAGAANALGTPPPAALNDVLAELRRLNGELAFRVIGTATAVTESGQYGEVDGMTLSVEQTAHVQGNTLNANISMALVGDVPPQPQAQTQVFVTTGQVKIGNLTLNTTLRRGEFLVLGESHYQSRGLEGPVFYIVHWAEE